MHLLVWECLCVTVCNCITCVDLCDHHHCSVTTKISTPLPLYSRIYPLPALIPDLWQPPICSLSLWFCHWGTLYKWSHAVCDFWDPPFHSASCPGDTPRSLWYQRMCVCVCVCVKSLQLFPTLWPHGLAHQAPLSMGFSRQEYWSGLPCPPPGDLPHPGIKPKSLTFPALAGGSLPLMPPGKLLASVVHSFLLLSCIPWHGCMYYDLFNHSPIE